MGLRKPQHEALTEASKAYDAGLRRIVIVAATGVGKTVIFSNLNRYIKFDGQMLVLAHRDELIKQAVAKMRHWNPTLKIGIEMGQEHFADADCDVIVASVATLGREDSNRIQRFNKHTMKCIVVDECHHSVADTYLNIFNHFGVLEERNDILLLGVTATPGRSDGEGLAKVYQKIVYQYTMRQAIEDGWLVDIRAIRVKTDTDLDKVNTRAGDFARNELAEEVNNPKRNQVIVKTFMQEAAARKAVAFTVDVRHAKDLAEMFNRYGVNAAAVWGDDPERAWKLARHQGPESMERYCRENGLPVPSLDAIQDLELQVLCNYGVLTEGYDDWRVSCVLMCRPTKSQTVLVQAVGRGMRLPEGTDNIKEALANGTQVPKKDCLVIDVVDTTKRHSLVTVPSLFGMNSQMDLNGGSVLDAVKQVEDAAKEYPDIDFSKLEKLDRIKALIEEAELWDVKFPEEITQNSTLAWHVYWDGSYRLTLPSGDQIQLKQNLLDQWEITAKIEGQKFRGIRDNMGDAFQAADGIVFKYAADSLRVLSREAPWHKDEATDGQWKQLKRLYKGKDIPKSLTKGQASKLIDQGLQKEDQIPATKEQLNFIQKFSEEPLPAGFTKRQASRKIADFIKGKVQGTTT